MNYKDAFKILEIEQNNINYNDISLEYLKKKYHKLALQNHPDKNGNTLESNEKFKQINEAYIFLQRELKYLNHDSNNVNFNSSTFTNFTDSNIHENKDANIDTTIYMDILQLFMQSIFEGNYSEIISSIIKDIVSGCSKISLKLFDGLDKDKSINIYNFLSNHRSILHLSQELLEEIREIVLKKYNHVVVYKLNPSITDLMNNNLYKLFVEDELFLVPLWYNELYFDASGCEIMVICEPQLNENIVIDDDNNIHFETNVEFENLHKLISENKDIIVDIGNKSFSIPVSELLMKREQYYRINGQGLTKTNNDIDIYNVSDKADIIVKIKII
jgi:curved DNA-binding protein CbpA